MSQDAINRAQEVTNNHLLARLNELSSDVACVRDDLGYIKGKIDEKEKHSDRQFSTKQGLFITFVSVIVSSLVSYFVGTKN